MICHDAWGHVLHQVVSLLLWRHHDQQASGAKFLFRQKGFFEWSRFSFKSGINGSVL